MFPSHSNKFTEELVDMIRLDTWEFSECLKNKTIDIVLNKSTGT